MRVSIDELVPCPKCGCSETSLSIHEGGWITLWCMGCDASFQAPGMLLEEIDCEEGTSDKASPQ